MNEEGDSDEGDKVPAGGGTRSERGASWAGEHGLRSSQAEKDGLLPVDPPATPNTDAVALASLPPSPAIQPGRSFEAGVSPPQAASLLTPDLTPPMLQTRLSDNPLSDRDIINSSERTRTKL